MSRIIDLDLFNSYSNDLSYVNKYVVNLNYPLPNLDLNKFNIIQDNYYLSRGKKVFMCGCAADYNNIGLQFLIDVAEDKGLEYITNEKGDLEIVSKNICFHLADMLSGELDALDRWTEYHDKGIRCVFVYPPDFSNPNKMNVYRNILLYHCGFAKKIYARNTVFRKYKSIVMKRFFEENNIAGYRGSSDAYVLEDKDTGEPYMCYLIGHSFFGKGKYDCEIARGACKLGVQVIGGASKLWKHIIQDNPDIKSIVYYCDRRQYDQRSIGHLMDSAAMKDLGQVYMLKGGRSFVNYWINDTYYNDRIWHHAGDYANREPARHKYVMDAIHNGDCISVYNPGSSVNIFVRTGYHLDNDTLKVVPD